MGRALADAHAAGIVHRDIKPDNILLETSLSPDGPPRVKLTDFGIARHVVESESLALTQTGSILGTPLYMSPEQCTGDGAIGPASDVYSLGATLFQLLAGRPPFQATTALAILGMHTSQPPPALEKLNDQVSAATCRLIERCLAKRPDERYTDGSALVEDLDRVLRGEPTGAAVHPQLPPHDPRQVVQYDFEWDLDSSPEQLWPYVSNTERLNRAIGLPAADFTAKADAEGHVQRFAEFRAAGFDNRWQEHPYEWIEGRKLGVLREFSAGPFKWFLSAVELHPRAGGGTHLIHRIRVEPHGILGRTVAAVKMGSQGKRSLGRVYQRIDAALRGRLGPAADPFEEAAPLPAPRRQKLDRLLDRLGKLGAEPRALERLGDFVTSASPQDIARIRPLALAARLGLPADDVTTACLLGAREGMFTLLWDLICPLCRIPSEIQPSLATLREHGHCPACQTDFALDFASSVEMIFRVRPDLRDSELGTFCIGGPGHSPHVVAQVRVAAGERLELELALGEGAYRLRGPNLPHHLELRVQAGVAAERLDLALTRAADWSAPRVLRAGRQRITLTNDAPRELVVRLERTASRSDALTAARASTLDLFRELFPGEVLAAGQLVSVATLTFLVVELDSPGNLYAELGDARAFAIVHALFGVIHRSIRQEHGALVKTVGEGVLAVFRESDAAVRAALAMPAALAAAEATRSLRLRAAIHRGPAMAATLNDALDYFGGVVREVWELAGVARGGKLAVSAAAATDAAAALAGSRSFKAQSISLLRTPETSKSCSKDRTLIVIGVNVFLQITGQNFASVYGTIFIKSLGTINPFTMTSINTAVNIFMVLVTQFLSDVTGRVPLMIAGATIQTGALFTMGGLGTAANATLSIRTGITTMLTVFGVGFQLGWAPLSHVVAAEIPTTRLRDQTYALGSVFNIAIQFIVSFSIPYLLNAPYANLGSKVGFIFGSTAFLAIFFSYFCIPECSNKTLEEIDGLFLEGVPIRDFRTATPVHPTQVTDDQLPKGSEKA